MSQFKDVDDIIRTVTKQRLLLKKRLGLALRNIAQIAASSRMVLTSKVQ